MRIAQVSPLFESVPPRLYGGTERIISYLTEELIRRGHDVTLYASGDSCTTARLVVSCDRGLRLNGDSKDPTVQHIVMLEKLAQNSHCYDVIHCHLDYLHYLLARRFDTPLLTTQHGRLDLPDLQPLYRMFAGLNRISISDAQRRPVPDAHWVGTVYHGLPRNFLSLNARPDGYLAFLGRMSPEKRVDRAIDIAVRAGVPLKIAAKIEPLFRDYVEQTVKPWFGHPLIDYVGEIGEREKQAFLGGARALLFPIDWPEPFGLVMIEALACGTPVIAYRHGSVPEVIEHGRTGYIVDNLEQAVAAVERVDRLDRAECRRVFERRFSVETMADAYVRHYENLAGGAYAGNVLGIVDRAAR